jgi:hypothetical protein
MLTFQLSSVAKSDVSYVCSMMARPSPDTTVRHFWQVEMTSDRVGPPGGAPEVGDLGVVVVAEATAGPLTQYA